MARPLRLERAGAWHHVMSRGLERRSIFLHVQDLLFMIGMREKLFKSSAQTKRRWPLPAARGRPYLRLIGSLNRTPILRKMGQGIQRHVTEQQKHSKQSGQNHCLRMHYGSRSAFA